MCTVNKTSNFSVVHLCTYTAFKVELNFTVPDVCLRLIFRFLPLRERTCCNWPGQPCVYRQRKRDEQNHHVSTMDVPTHTHIHTHTHTHTDVKGIEIRRSLPPILRCTTANPSTRKSPIHIMRHMSADICGVESCLKSSSLH